MEVNEQYSFQVDSEIVQNIYKNQNNYLIEYSSHMLKEYCIIYFSSNDIYYPNTFASFKEQLIKKNKFEWYKTRINFGHKHIFIRDIKKQWYLNGINSYINTPQKLLLFLKNETQGYRIITLGSSAGGFAAVIYGQLLNADRIYTFNGQFEIRSILNNSTEATDPLIFRNKQNKKLEIWYDSRNFITNPSSIYYFHSIKSSWDNEQYAQIKNILINHIQMKTSNHGVPFLHSNLPFVINMDISNLHEIAESIRHPLIFSLKTIGFFKTIIALTAIIKFGVKKIYIHTILKYK